MKKQLYQHLQQLVEQKIVSANTAIASAKESRDNETKSSMGDKYETGRAMMQIAMSNAQDQLNKALILQKELDQLDIEKAYQKVEEGSLVSTNHGDYFISIGVGVVELQRNTYFAISFASPVGKLLKGKKAGDQFSFQTREYTINSIS
ncbi:MAG: 3-oxoacyl-ACP synthase [Cyclobacteriaceae bacterium]